VALFHLIILLLTFPLKLVGGYPFFEHRSRVIYGSNAILLMELLSYRSINKKILHIVIVGGSDTKLLE
jgi:hypothetical protein